MLSAARAEITELLADVRTSRKPSLRRASSDDWLLACDLPLCASAEETAAWTEQAREWHWRVGGPPGGGARARSQSSLAARRREGLREVLTSARSSVISARAALSMASAPPR